MTAHILPWLRRMARQAEVWIADPGRAYLPREGLTAFASYRVPTSLELEDRTERQVTLYGLAADRVSPFGFGLGLAAAAIATCPSRSPSATGRRSRCPTPAARRPAWPSRAA